MKLFWSSVILCVCLSSSVKAEGLEVTVKRRPIEVKVKKLLSNIILNNPEKLAVDESIFLKVPRSIKKIEQKAGAALRILAQDDHVTADALNDFLDLFLVQLQKTPFDTPLSKKHLFNVLSQACWMETLYGDYEYHKMLLERDRTTSFFKIINYIEECQCFSRRSHPFRKEVEARIIQHLAAVRSDKNKELVITEFASGNLFEMFMVANVLISKGYRKLRLNCLDIEYQLLIDHYKTQMKQGQKNFVLVDNVYPWSSQDLSIIHNTLKRAMRFDLIDKSAKNYETLVSKRNEKLGPFFDLLYQYRLHKVLYQFMRWFMDDNKNQVTLVLYGDAQEYIDACKKNNNLKSDIIFAIDYYPEENYGWWDKLRRNALKKDGKAFAIHDFSLDGEFTFGRSLSKLNYYLSEGAPQELLHYEWVVKGKPVTWKTTDETRIVQGKKLNVKVPDYGKYYLHRIREIPERIVKYEFTDFETGVTTEKTRMEPAIPEIIPKK